MAMTPERLAEIRERCERVGLKDGPWRVAQVKGFGGSVFLFGPEPEPWCPIADLSGAGDQTTDFIAHARQDVPDLLDEVERLKREIEDMKLDHKEEMTLYDE